MTDNPFSITLDHEPQQVSSLPPVKLFTHYKDDEYNMEIDNSTLEYFHTCDRSLELKKIYGREKNEVAAALVAGGALHEGFDYHYKGKSEDECNKAIAKFFSDKGQGMFNEWRNLDRVLDTFKRYREHYASDPLVPLVHKNSPCVELPFRIPLCTIPVNDQIPYRKSTLVADCEDDVKEWKVSKIHVYWTGKIDLVGTYSNYNVQADHKTASMFGPLYWKTYQKSAQMKGYRWACNKLGIRANATLINLIYWRPPTQKDEKIGKAPKTEFHRQLFFYTDRAIEKWEMNTQQLIVDLISHLVHGYFPEKESQCIGKYGVCQFFDVCTLPEEQQLAYLFSDVYRNCQWSPLKS